MKQDKHRSVFLVVALTWVNLGVLVTNVLLSVRTEESVSRVARTNASMPAFLSVRQRPSSTPADERASLEASDAALAPKEVRIDVLDPETLDRIVDRAYVRGRVRSRITALLLALDRLTRRMELRMDDEVRAMLVHQARGVTRARAELEQRLSRQRSPKLDDWDRQLEALDDKLRKSARIRLETVLSKPEADRVLRYLVPQRSSKGGLR